MSSKFSLAAAAVLAALVSFVLPAQAYTRHTLFTFCIKGCHRGPIGVTRDGAGNLYAVTTFDRNGQPAGAAVFKLVPDGDRYDYQLLHQFEGLEGVPDAPPIVDVNGNVYGTTPNLVYELTPNQGDGEWTFKQLYKLCGGCFSDTPAGPLTYAGAASGAAYDGVSPLYTTHQAGAFGGGRVIELMPQGDQWNTTVLYEFCNLEQCLDGQAPVGGVYLASSGMLFGVTERGGASGNCDDGCGTVYQLKPGKHGSLPWKLTTLHNFCKQAGCKDGALPGQPLTMDATGNLIGTTAFGGTADTGTLFKLTPNGGRSKEKVLHSFCADCSDGFSPSSGVVIDETGAIFGETLDSTPGKGTVYRYADSTYSVAYAFCVKNQACPDGWQPEGGLLLDATGDLTGVTLYGGKNGLGGIVFELTP